MATTKKVAPKKSTTKKAVTKVVKKTGTNMPNVSVKKHGKKFLVKEQSEDGGIYKDSISEINPLEENE